MIEAEAVKILPTLLKEPKILKDILANLAQRRIVAKKQNEPLKRQVNLKKQRRNYR